MDLDGILLTRPISHSRIERRSDNPNIKWNISITQAFNMLQMGEGGDAGESPLEYIQVKDIQYERLLLNTTKVRPYLSIPLSMQFVIGI